VRSVFGVFACRDRRAIGVCDGSASHVTEILGAFTAGISADEMVERLCCTLNFANEGSRRVPNCKNHYGKRRYGVCRNAIVLKYLRPFVGLACRDKNNDLVSFFGADGLQRSLTAWMAVPFVVDGTADVLAPAVSCRTFPVNKIQR